MCDVGCDKFAQRTPAHQGLGAGRRCAGAALVTPYICPPPGLCHVAYDKLGPADLCQRFSRVSRSSSLRTSARNASIS
jgi:hypothetical protein